MQEIWEATYRKIGGVTTTEIIDKNEKNWNEIYKMIKYIMKDK